MLHGQIFVMKSIDRRVVIEREHIMSSVCITLFYLFHQNILIFLFFAAQQVSENFIAAYM